MSCSTSRETAQRAFCAVTPTRWSLWISILQDGAGERDRARRHPPLESGAAGAITASAHQRQLSYDPRYHRFFHGVNDIAFVELGLLAVAKTHASVHLWGNVDPHAWLAAATAVAGGSLTGQEVGQVPRAGRATPLPTMTGLRYSRHFDASVVQDRQGIDEQARKPARHVPPGDRAAEAGGRGTALDDNSTIARDVLGKGDVGACTRA